MVNTSLAIRGRRSAGSKTSPQANWTCFAALNSTSSLFARAWEAPSSSSVTFPAAATTNSKMIENYVQICLNYYEITKRKLNNKRLFVFEKKREEKNKDKIKLDT